MKKPPLPSVEEMANALTGMQETWKVMLDGMEGMVAEAVRRGYTERESRTMVARIMAGQDPGAPEDEA